jgi:hypothetical protein
MLMVVAPMRVAAASTAAVDVGRMVWRGTELRDQRDKKRRQVLPVL